MRPNTTLLHTRMLRQLACGFARFDTCGLPPRSLVASAMNVSSHHSRVRQRRLLLWLAILIRLGAINFTTRPGFPPEPWAWRWVSAGSRQLLGKGRRIGFVLADMHLDCMRAAGSTEQRDDSAVLLDPRRYETDIQHKYSGARSRERAIMCRTERLQAEDVHPLS